MNKEEFINAVDIVAKEKNISKDLIFEAMELALASAYKKNFDSKTNVRVNINRDTGEIKVFKVLYVVDEISEEDMNTIMTNLGEKEEIKYFIEKIAGGNIQE